MCSISKGLSVYSTIVDITYRPVRYSRYPDVNTSRILVHICAMGWAKFSQSRRSDGLTNIFVRLTFLNAAVTFIWKRKVFSRVEIDLK